MSNPSASSASGKKNGTAPQQHNKAKKPAADGEEAASKMPVAAKKQAVAAARSKAAASSTEPAAAVAEAPVAAAVVAPKPAAARAATDKTVKPSKPAPASAGASTVTPAPRGKIHHGSASSAPSGARRGQGGKKVLKPFRRMSRHRIRVISVAAGMKKVSHDAVPFLHSFIERVVTRLVNGGAAIAENARRRKITVGHLEEAHRAVFGTTLYTANSGAAAFDPAKRTFMSQIDDDLRAADHARPNPVDKITFFEATPARQ